MGQAVRRAPCSLRRELLRKRSGDEQHTCRHAASVHSCNAAALHQSGLLQETGTHACTTQRSAGRSLLQARGKLPLPHEVVTSRSRLPRPRAYCKWLGASKLQEGCHGGWVEGAQGAVELPWADSALARQRGRQAQLVALPCLQGLQAAAHPGHVLWLRQEACEARLCIQTEAQCPTSGYQKGLHQAEADE